MKKLLSIIALICLVQPFIFSQAQEGVAANGKKVLLNVDGTWKYMEVKKDSMPVNLSDCSNWISTNVDKITGVSSTSVKSTLVVSTDGGIKGFGIFMMLSGKGDIILSIQAVGASQCVAERSIINILFTDGSRLELFNDGKFNCKGKATVYFGGSFGKKKELNELKSKSIQSMRVWTSDSYVEKDFTVDNQTEFKSVINCLSK